MKLDLHMHSTASDGGLTPRQLVEFINEKCDVDVMALTDHDTVAGVKEAADACTQIGMRFIPGIEISSLWGQANIHIVGLGIDIRHQELLQTTTYQCEKRDRRALEIGRRLEELGYPGMYERALAHTHTKMNVSRLHFALSLKDVGVVKNVQEAFDRFLMPGKPAYVQAMWSSVADAVGLIHRAGGVAVLAHPGRYRFKNDWEYDALVEGFAEAGGEGIEAISGSQSPKFMPRCLQWAKRFNFVVSTGSDFHRCDGVRPLPGTQGQLTEEMPASVLTLLG